MSHTSSLSIMQICMFHYYYQCNCYGALKKSVLLSQNNIAAPAKYNQHIVSYSDLLM